MAARDLSVATRAGTATARVLDYIRECGDRGATDPEIADALAMHSNTQAPARHSLWRAGLIREKVDDDLQIVKRASTRSSALCIVWEVTP